MFLKILPIVSPVGAVLGQVGQVDGGEIWPKLVKLVARICPKTLSIFRDSGIYSIANCSNNC